MPDVGAPEVAAPDYRLVGVAAAAWTGALLAQAPTASWLLAGGWLVLIAVRSGMLGKRFVAARLLLSIGACLLVATAVFGIAVLRHTADTGGRISDLAEQGAVVEFDAEVRSDPRVSRASRGSGDPLVFTRVVITSLTRGGEQTRTRTPVLVFADEAWLDVPLGATVRSRARLSPDEEGGDVAALARAVGDVEVTRTPDLGWRAAGRVRESIRASVAGRPPDQAALVPALVDGDDAGMDASLEADFRATGLTHLTAVSGTNLTLVVGFLIVLARLLGVRGRALIAIGGLGIAGFILLARTEPSVLRAAAMGTIGLLAMSHSGRGKALRGLSVAVIVLLLFSPGLATTVGFALSVLATAGIVVVAPIMRDSLNRWLPRTASEAIAIPLAAQLTCTPLIAAISGEVSLVAVAANLVVAPAVAPATVLGLAGGLVGLVSGGLGAVLGWGAATCVGWIVWVARTGADLPVPAISWGTGALELTALVVLVLVIAAAAPLLLRRPRSALAVCALVAVVVSGRGTSGLPGWVGVAGPDDWFLAMCDVGQGDAVVLRTGPEQAVLVDVGPDPDLVDDCLDDLGVERLDAVVLTHFHADHVDGLAGALNGRQVDRVEATSLQQPVSGFEQVARTADDAGIDLVGSDFGNTRRFGDLTLQVVWPSEAMGETPGIPRTAEDANDASVVLLAELNGVTMLLTGDIEPPAQSRLAAILPALQVDVLKVPHHGSRYQQATWLESLEAQVALVSVGAENTYGHPSAEVLESLDRAGAQVARTDTDGAIWLTENQANIEVHTSG